MKTGVFWGAGAALLLGVAARWASVPARSGAALPPANGFWSVGQTIATLGLRDVSLSPNGASLAWTNKNGVVRRVDANTGRTVWGTAPLAGVNRVIADDTGAVAAFSALNPLRNSVVILDAQKGDKKTRIFAGSGAVWCAAFGRNGAFVGTGGRAVYTVSDTAPSDTPLFRTDGVPDGITLAANASRLFVSHWSPGGVIGCDLAGHTAPWRFGETETGRTCRVSVSADGARVLVLSGRGARNEAPVLRVHSGKTGAILWQAALPKGAADATALLSADGNTAVATYRRTAKRSDPDDLRLACFDADGRRTFADKGSALFAPRLLSVAGNGKAFTVQSGDATFFTLDVRGNFLNRLRLAPDVRTGKPVRVVSAQASGDGHVVVLRLRGDTLIVLHSNGAVE